MKKYEDMLDLEHPVSRRHAQMPLKDRAAQFSPFAALTGYEDAIEETGRITEKKLELEEDRKRELDEILRKLQYDGEKVKRVRITYFKKDLKKEGGSYQIAEGEVLRIDTYQRQVVLCNQKIVSYIYVEDILEIEIQKL